MLKSERFSLPPAALPADANIRHQYPINRGQWIVHPDIQPREDSFCRYTLEFTIEEEATVELHVSADNRFELLCDGAFVGMGPDRSDVEHWSFHSYRVRLEPGAHALEAEVPYVYKGFAYAQTSVEPGFVLYAESSPVDLNTGSAPWKVTRLAGLTAAPPPMRSIFGVGPDYTIEAAAFFAPPAPVEAVVLRKAGFNHAGGNILPGWKLRPSRLPEQVRRPVGGGVVRSVSSIGDEDPFPADDATPDPAWQAFVEGRAPMTVPPSTRVVVLWDLRQYHTAFPELTTRGGQGARVRVAWAESCFETEGSVKDRERNRKGNRDEIAGKYFRGNGDTFLPDGPTRTFRPYWWRAGRYVRIVVETAEAPLTLERIRLLESRMPLESESAFASSDGALAPVVDLAVRGVQMCAHETYMDCPYYEQLMYVGDTRLQVLTAYVMSREDRLNQRALELFDWSRRETGFVLERHPSRPKQLSATFAMIWVLMLRDHAWWRNEPDFVRDRLKGLRCLLEEFKELSNAECRMPNAERRTRKAPDSGNSAIGNRQSAICNRQSAIGNRQSAILLPPLPGWSFVDWVDTLSFVNPPGPEGSVAAVVNLLFLNALNAAAELEEHFGEPHLAAYNRTWAKRLAAAVDATFWDEARGLFADDPEHTRYSEHSQCLALLGGHFPEREARCFESLVTAPDLLRATVYFSFYLLETFAKVGRGDLLLEKLGFWKDLVDQGFKTPIETPEPSRSDCHAWGSHPLFHLHASIAGIRPAAPGFAAVRIEPQPGGLTEIASTVPHPAGSVSLKMAKTGDTWQTEVALPPGVEGELVWRGKHHALAGEQELVLQGEG